MKGVPHYKRDGTEHKGNSHKMANGTVHTNKSHIDELSKTAKKKAKK